MPTTTNQSGRADDAREDTSERLLGTRIGKYEIVRIVGKGGMGCVYEALNTTIQKRVAIKVIDSELAKNDEAYERFHREALAASAIESPHIVQIFDGGKTEGGVPFIVMELLRGMDLGAYIRQNGQLALDEALHVAIHMLKGLHHAHTSGIVHRDLKPDNVFLVDREDDPMAVKLLDFGVSKISRATDVPLETLTRQGTVVGTPFYMSPEQAQAFPDVDHRTDIYSVGAVLFECLAGRTVHVGKSYEQVIVNICMKDVDDVRTHNTDVPDEIAAVIKKALSREAEDRYQGARDMLNALVDAAPESFREGAPSGKLRGVSLGGIGGSLPHTPMVISPAPASRAPSELADTVNVDSGTDQPVLSESGVTSKVERVDTLPSDPRAEGKGDEHDDGATNKGNKPAVAVEARARSVSAPTVTAEPSRRRWALAAAPGVALLLGLAIYVLFGGSAESDASVASDAVEMSPREPEVSAAPSDAVAVPEHTPKAAATAVADAAPAASASSTNAEADRARALSPPVKPVNKAKEHPAAPPPPKPVATKPPPVQPPPPPVKPPPAPPQPTAPKLQLQGP